MSELLRCGSDGVPCLVQKLEYVYSARVFNASFINGLSKIVSGEGVTRYINFLKKTPTDKEMIFVEAVIERAALDNWITWFDDDNFMKGVEIE